MEKEREGKKNENEAKPKMKRFRSKMKKQINGTKFSFHLTRTHAGRKGVAIFFYGEAGRAKLTHTRWGPKSNMRISIEYEFSFLSTRTHAGRKGVAIFFYGQRGVHNLLLRDGTQNPK